MLLRRKLLLNFFKFSDISILLVSLLFAWFVTRSEHAPNLETLLMLHVEVLHVIFVLLIVFLWELFFHGLQLYESRRLENRMQEWKDIVIATTFGCAAILLFSQVFNINIFTGYFLSIFWLSSTILTIFLRAFLRFFLKKLRLYGRNLRFVLIVGTNKRAYDFAHRIEKSQGLGYRIIGYVDDKIYFPNGKVKLLGNLSNFSSILNSQVIDEVVIALPIKSYYEKIQHIIEKAEEQGIIIRYLTDIFNTNLTKLRSSTFAGFPLLTTVTGIDRHWQYFVKRIMDLVLGFMLIILTCPLMLAAALAIKITSKEPVFFIQNRVGYNKRIFHLYKLRTMRVGAESEQEKIQELNEMDGPVFKIHNDPRITKIGHWLRKTSIDELPQLFNVLKGDMSLVGPRPLPVRDFNGFNKDWQRRRFSIKPGITCIWQVSGRNGILFDDWMKLDMDYIDNWSLIGDLKILFKTIPVVILARGAS
ncbi:MAG: sugar transferase [Desulfobacteraceae bacterium]|nr:sugar transferase [Desulfobacteraceae bacterium]MBC2720739.1 sugar transferase [Desulfobacteraceae bacterium]